MKPKVKMEILLLRGLQYYHYLFLDANWLNIIVVFTLNNPRNHMCGIVGLIDQNFETIPENLVNTMRDTMVARGPDGVGNFIEGKVAMAMRRLSIIDLEHGWQPLKSENGQVVAFQNGEIYNYQELRKELERKGFLFRTSSDTEVLAHGFAQWGIEGLLKRIDGMYAIAILDRQRRELHLARDRFGEKPLFYCHAPGRFAYSSNLVALAALPWVKHTIDDIGLDRYLALHFVPGERTILESIKRVLPGERLCVSIDYPEPKRHRYYCPLISRQQRISDDELADCIEKAVSSRLVADVPIGVFLSGGLDSSTVAAIAAQKNPKIDTFSMGFTSEAHDESIYAEKVAQTVGTNHHHFLFDEKSFINLLPQVADALDEPLGDQAMLPLYWLCQEARQYVTVVLSGEGADELFAGYSYYKPFVNHKSWQENWKERVKLLLRLSPQTASYNRLAHNPVPTTPSGFPLLADAAERSLLMENSCFEADEWEEQTLHWLNSASDPLRKASATDVATWLPDDLLVKYDRMAMAHSLEGRAPFLQPQLAEAGLQLPRHQRMTADFSKVALRRVASRWLPQEILQRPKQGFVLPMRSWLQTWLKTYAPVHEYFNQHAFPGLNTDKVVQLVEDDLEQGVTRERLLFALVVLFEWHQRFTRKVQDLRSRYQSCY